MGGTKGVGESTTSAVVLSLVGIFIADFTRSHFVQGILLIYVICQTYVIN